MKPYEFKQAKFIKTAVKPTDYPVLRNLSGKIMPEVAIAGRSNVGKSSLLNDLFSAPQYGQDLHTPLERHRRSTFSHFHKRMAFVDLPGYGYHRYPSASKKNRGPMVRSYLEQRESLKLILFLMDIRRIPNADDKQFVEWVVHRQKAMILVLTKVDKVNQAEKAANTKAILADLNLDQLHHVQYSVQKKLGRKELIYMINDALTDELNERRGLMTDITKQSFICLDCETTGLDAKKDRIIEVAVMRFDFSQTYEEIDEMIDPECPISPESIAIHHITEEMIKGKPKIHEVAVTYSQTHWKPHYHRTRHRIRHRTVG